MPRISFDDKDDEIKDSPFSVYPLVFLNFLKFETILITYELNKSLPSYMILHECLYGPTIHLMWVYGDEYNMDNSNSISITPPALVAKFDTTVEPRMN